MTTPHYQIRADFDQTTIVVYQAFPPTIAKPALQAQTFVEPFSFNRMTWIKPSFLWLMERSNWAQSPGQEKILAVRITREGWERALRLAVLTTPLGDADEWQRQLKASSVRVQWDPERSLRGGKLQHRSIQIGLRSTITPTYAKDWIQEIVDMTPVVLKIRGLLRAGSYQQAERQLPPEVPYPLPEEIERRLDML